MFEEVGVANGKCPLKVRQINLLLPMRLEQHAIDNVDIDRSSGGSANRFEHRRQAQIATATQHAICRANDQFCRTAGERAMSQAQVIQFTLHELTHRVIMQPTRYNRVGDTTLDIQIDGAVAQYWRTQGSR